MKSVIKNIFLFIIICSSFNVYPANWVKAVNGKEVIYVDIDSIRKTNSLVFYSSLANMASMGLNSLIIKHKADCLKKKVTQLNITYYGQTMGRGISYKEENTKGEGIYPKPHTTQYILMKFVCDHVQ